MLRSAALALVMIAALGAGAVAQERDPDTASATLEAEAEAFTPDIRSDGFVISGDSCGASRYAHLIGRNYADVTQASLLPADSMAQNPYALRTLEYTPHKLNVSVGSDGRIIAIGCF